MHTVLIPLAALVAAVLVAPATALAGDGCHDPIAAVAGLFDGADADGDGLLTPDEYDRAELTRYGASFEDTDANGDGTTTFDEYVELYQRIHARVDEREV